LSKPNIKPSHLLIGVTGGHGGKIGGQGFLWHDEELLLDEELLQLSRLLRFLESLDLLQFLMFLVLILSLSP